MCTPGSVPIRDASGAFLPGVGGEDDGPKSGLNGVDNGRLHFSGVRVPRANLLNRYGDVAHDGTYSSPIAGPGRRFFTMLGTLVQGRVSLAGAANTAAKIALQIAVTYACERRQFAAADGDEQVLLDYPRHQRRLLTRLAGVYAATYAQDELLLDFHRVFSGEHDTDDSRQELETFAAAEKAAATWYALETIQECREACGGAGFLAENRLGQLHADLDVYATFEGDNTVLLQLVGKRLLTQYGRRLQHAGPAGAARIVAAQALSGVAAASGLAGLGHRLADGGTTAGAARSLRDPAVQERILTERVEVAVAEIAPALRPRPGVSAAQLAQRFGEHQHALIEAAAAEARLRQWRAFTRALEREVHEPTRALLALVRDVFALQAIERDLGWYLVRRRLSVTRARAVTRLLDALLTRMRPHALDLVQAFGYEQGHLRAEIASGAEAERQAEARAAR